MPKPPKKIIKVKVYKTLSIMVTEDAISQLDDICALTKLSRSVVIDCLIVRSDAKLIQALCSEGLITRRHVGRSKKSYHA